MSRRTVRNLNFVVLILLLFFYVLGEWVIGRFPVTDEGFYKAAGRNWAISKKFAAPELVGRGGVYPGAEDFFFLYVPVYPFLFGLFAHVFGFGPTQCSVFDGIIHVIFVFFIFRLIQRRTSGWNLGATTIAFLALMRPENGRPDEMGLSFAVLASLLSDGRKNLFHLCLSGLFLGLSATTSPVVGIFGAIQIAIERFEKEQHSSIRPLILIFATTLITIGSVLGICLWPHPSVYQQFLANGGLTLIPTIRGALLFSLKNGWMRMMFLLPVILMAISVGFSELQRKNFFSHRKTFHILLITMGTILGIVVLRGRPTYYWMASPLLLSITSALFYEKKGEIKSLLKYAVKLSFFIAVIPSSVLYLKEKAILLSLPPSQTLDSNKQKIQNLIPKDGIILTEHLWWIVANDYRTLLHWAEPRNTKTPVWLVLGGIGSGAPGKVNFSFPKWVLTDGVRHHLTSNLMSERNTIGPFSLSKSGNGFGFQLDLWTPHSANLNLGP